LAASVGRAQHHRAGADADTYDGTVEVEEQDTQDASLTVPSDVNEGETIHIICEVTDAGTPKLTRYQRVMMTIK
jgi:hypothetical protein